MIFVYSTSYSLQVHILQLALFVPMEMLQTMQTHQIVLDSYSAGILSRSIWNVSHIISGMRQLKNAYQEHVDSIYQIVSKISYN